MSVFKDFELEVVDLLTQEVLSQDLRARLVQEAQLVRLDFTGVGYLLTVRHSELPLERIVCNVPSVSGEVNGILTGFVIFLMDHELTIECFSFGVDMPESFREHEVMAQVSQDNSRV